MACCRDYTRAALLRQGAARAGQGLPTVEPGMPVPAGTGMTRRSMMLRSAGVAVAVYGASKLTPLDFDEGVAAAAGPDGAVLVSIFWDGGIDSLNVLAPVDDTIYRNGRPTLRLDRGQGATFTEDPRLMWHPQAAPFATLHGEDKVTVLPAVGYADANQSHFTTRPVWEVGETNPFSRTGWLGRYLDAYGSTDNPLQGLSLDGALSPALAAASKPVSAIWSPDDFGFYSRHVWGQPESTMVDAIGRLGEGTTSDPTLAHVRRIQRDTDRLRRQLAALPSSTEPYPEGMFGDRLRSLASMLGANMPLKIVTLTAPGGYDTHSDQAGDFADGLGATAQGVLAFQRDLERRGLADRVIVHLWSEFGRRPDENGSLGTDHGAAGVSLLVGSRVRGRMINEFPGLDRLDEDDNLRHTSDFRAVYKGLLEQWLNGDPSRTVPGAGAILPGAAGFTAPGLIR